MIMMKKEVLHQQCEQGDFLGTVKKSIGNVNGNEEKEGDKDYRTGDYNKN